MPRRPERTLRHLSPPTTSPSVAKGVDVVRDLFLEVVAIGGQLIGRTRHRSDVSESLAGRVLHDVSAGDAFGCPGCWQFSRHQLKSRSPVVSGASLDQSRGLGGPLVLPAKFLAPAQEKGVSRADAPSSVRQSPERQYEFGHAAAACFCPRTPTVLTRAAKVEADGQTTFSGPKPATLTIRGHIITRAL